MKRYSTIFTYNIPLNDLYESIIVVPREELDKIQDTILDNKKFIFQDKNKNDILCNQLSKYVKKYKIVFVYTDQNYKNFIIKGNFDQYNDTIYIYCSKNINLITNQKTNNLLYFVKNLYIILGHELLHRIQFIKRDRLVIFNTKKETDIKQQLSDNQEIMAYAFEAVEEFRYNGFPDQEILKILRNASPDKFQSHIIRYYHKYFEHTEVLKKFYKYMYLYLTNKNEE